MPFAKSRMYRVLPGFCTARQPGSPANQPAQTHFGAKWHNWLERACTAICEGAAPFHLLNRACAVFCEGQGTMPFARLGMYRKLRYEMHLFTKKIQKQRVFSSKAPPFCLQIGSFQQKCPENVEKNVLKKRGPTPRAFHYRNSDKIETTPKRQDSEHREFTQF